MAVLAAPGAAKWHHERLTVLSLNIQSHHIPLASFKVQGLDGDSVRHLFVSKDRYGEWDEQSVPVFIYIHS